MQVRRGGAEIGIESLAPRSVTGHPRRFLLQDVSIIEELSGQKGTTGALASAGTISVWVGVTRREALGPEERGGYQRMRLTPGRGD